MSMTHCNQGLVKGTISQIFPKEKVVNLTVCSVKEYWTKEGEKKTQFSYVPCVSFGHEANIARNLNKGDLVTIIYSAGQNSYEKDGKKIYNTQLVVESIALNKKASDTTAKKQSLEDEELSLDNVPF